MDSEGVPFPTHLPWRPRTMHLVMWLVDGLLRGEGLPQGTRLPPRTWVEIADFLNALQRYRSFDVNHTGVKVFDRKNLSRQFRAHSGKMSKEVRRRPEALSGMNDILPYGQFTLEDIADAVHQLEGKIAAQEQGNAAGKKEEYVETEEKDIEMTGKDIEKKGKDIEMKGKGIEMDEEDSETEEEDSEVAGRRDQPAQEHGASSSNTYGTGSSTNQQDQPVQGHLPTAAQAQAVGHGVPNLVDQTASLIKNAFKENGMDSMISGTKEEYL
ncbi:hypothetical protein DSL72_008068 [Monilinia vaccinii-corymbosi]|uniref:Uncharacterized protein n=1 Tax=Monilinia vaccinii-corymbosi TaxID=61207 RepID=A0A8A3PJR6_9HELO|nr:hypothetical protein DSL72_008068 [Monilinia vaccinii-corymbosi]